MPLAPLRHTEDEQIELNARIMRLHDPEEINARDRFNNMRFQRVAVCLMGWALTVAAYYIMPFIVNAKNWPAILRVLVSIAWIVGHFVAVAGAVCLIAYLLVGGRIFEELDT